jgi:hypothetical protein
LAFCIFQTKIWRSQALIGVERKGRISPLGTYELDIISCASKVMIKDFLTILFRYINFQVFSSSSVGKEEAWANMGKHGMIKRCFFLFLHGMDIASRTLHAKKPLLLLSSGHQQQPIFWFW